jgi:hypothetical protein
MKRFLFWSVVAAGTAVGVYLGYEFVSAARRRTEESLRRAETIAGHTRAALEETERTLRDARRTVQ